MASDSTVRIRRLVENLLQRRGDQRSFHHHDRLISTGRLDSLDTMELITSLESEFGLQVEPGNFDPTDFDTIEAIAKIVQAP